MAALSLSPPRILALAHQACVLENGRLESQAAQKGPDARRRPAVRVERRRLLAVARRELGRFAGEAYSLYVEPAAEGANEADGPFSAACHEVSMHLQINRTRLEESMAALGRIGET